MSLKTVFLLVCSLIAVNSFMTSRSDDKNLHSGRSSLFPLTGYGVKSSEQDDSRSNEQRQFGRSYTNNEEGSIVDGQTESTYRNQGPYDGRRPERTGGQKLRIKYSSSSSSSSSEEHSSESHEIRNVEKQYHDNNGYSGGRSHYQHDRANPRNYKVMNFEASDVQNTIDKDM